MKRIFTNIFLLFCIIFFPPYISGLGILITIFLCENFIESIFWAFILDTVYGGGRIVGFSFPYIFTLGTTIIYFASARLKTLFRV